MPGWVGDVAFIIVALLGAQVAIMLMVGDRFDRYPLLVVTLVAYAVTFGLVPAVAGGADVAPGIYAKAGITALLGLLGLLAGWLLPQPRFSRRIRPIKYEPDCVVRLSVAFAVLALAGFVTVAISSAGSIAAFLSGSRFAYRGAGNPIVSAFGGGLTQLCLVPPFLLIGSGGRRATVGGYLYAAVVAPSIYLVLNGSRALAIAVVGSAILGRLWGTPHRRLRRASLRSLKQISSFLIAGPVILLLVVTLYDARAGINSAATDDATAVRQAFAQLDADRILANESVSYSKVLFFTVESIPARHDFMWASPLRRAVFFFLPTGDLKPRDPNLIIGELYSGSARLVLPPTLPGEGYAVAGGVVGSFVWMCMYGLLGARLERRAASSRVIRTLLGSVLVYLVLVGMRGQFYTLAVVVAFQWLWIMGVDRYGIRFLSPSFRRGQARDRLATPAPASLT